MSTMEENKFEKQVQQKMDELKLNPSDTVWGNIQARIEKRKKRRGLILIFSLLFIALFSGGYWFLNSPGHPESKGKEAININPQIQYKDSALQNTGNSSEEKTEAGPVTLNQKKSSNHIFERDNTDNNSFKGFEKTVSKKIRKRKFFGKQKTGNLVAVLNSSQVETVPVNKNDNDDVKSQEFDGENDTNNKNGKLSPDLKNDFKESNKIEKGIVAIQDSTIESKIQQDTLANTIPVKRSVDIPLKNRWHIGIFIAGGVSHIGNQFLGLGNSSNADYLQSPGNSNTGGGPLIINPSKVKNSLGYTAGIFLEKNISKKTKVSFGINYKEFNTSNLVGKKNDTTARYYYSSTANGRQRYKNNFRFVELPMQLRVQLGINKVLPLFWSGGITLSQLVSSNALQFDPNTGTYYKNNSILNKTQLGFSTGLSTSLFQNSKPLILFGPYFYYAASQLAGNGLYNKKHFVFIGLHTEIIFSKK